MKTTFPFISAPLARSTHGPLRRPKSLRSTRRGFTLIEMMVVVLVIAISAAIAMPGVVKRMKSNRTKIAAEKIAMIYRQAQVRSLGRASATLVSFNSGVVTVREAIQGPDATAGCEALPASSCLIPADRWTTNRSQQVSSVDFVGGGDFAVSLIEADATVSTSFEVCFTPSGRSFGRNNVSNPLAPLSGVFRINVERVDGVGFMRSVLVAPNGAARVMAAVAAP